MNDLFIEIGLLIIVATIFGITARLFKQPSVLAYVLAGIILGPIGLGVIKQPELISSLSSFGIALLLFLVGLELNLVKLKAIGKSSLIMGIAQVIVTAGLGFVAIIFLGYKALPALYISAALTFASTIIVIKLLSEKRSLDSLHGRLTVGLLLVQDFLAILALLFLAGLNNGANLSIGQAVMIMVAKGTFLLILALACNRWLLPPVFNLLARSEEMLFLASLSWCFLFAIFSAFIGFSLEIGAFLAGVTLASLPYNLEISSKLKGLRDFFLTIFFIALGSQLVLGATVNYLLPIILLILFVLIIDPLIVMIIGGLMGYRKRTSFMIGLAMSQVSEFSLILMGVGLRLGHVQAIDVSVVTIVGIATITISTYFITHGEKIYRALSPYLNIFEKVAQIEETEADTISGHVVIFGYHRLGEQIVATLQNLHKPIVVIDFNPVAIRYLKEQNIPCFYGDMTDLELLEKSQMNQAALIISTNSNPHDNLTLLQNLKLHNIKVPIYLTADTWHDARDLYDAGADYVIFPHYLAGVQFSKELAESLNNKDILHINKAQHLAELEHRYNRVR